MKAFFDLFPVIFFFLAFFFSSHDPAHAASLASHVPVLSQVILAAQNSTPPKTPDQIAMLIATAVTMVASVVQLVFAWIKWRKIDKMLIVSFVLIMAMGGATLYFDNPDIIKYKPTGLYWIFAAVLLFSQWVRGQNLMKVMMGKQMSLPEPVWNGVNYAWVLFFAVMGLLNICIAQLFSYSTWVNFKLFGTLGLTVVFVVAQGVLLSKHMTDEPVQRGNPSDKD
ncbi:intracellular septation protein [Silvimonas terrae]|uniref:Inner membrane-spanning protein YciB n=1 Tax=Silvimonas terrae TaxID=300266 RepID=A0A840RBN4_9NEIS|nr:septation protein A [Silvimonas terrae]MBB5190337.1 intracellular septation protein [Silvimonas terrae]